MIVVPKEAWDTMGDTGAQVIVDVSRTPLSRIAQDSCFIAAEATRFSASSGQVDIIRHDPKDAKEYNRDRYSVTENLADHPDYDQMIRMADTKASPELTAYVRHHVFLTRQSADGQDWHWQHEDDLSSPVRVEIQKRRESQHPAPTDG